MGRGNGTAAARFNRGRDDDCGVRALARHVAATIGSGSQCVPAVPSFPMLPWSWLSLLLFANAASLQAGPGGVRTGSSILNHLLPLAVGGVACWFAAVRLVPRECADRHRLQPWLVLSAAAALVLSIPTCFLWLPVAGLLFGASPWLQLALLAALPAAELWRRRRPKAWPFCLVVRAVAAAAVLLHTAVLLFLVAFWTPGVWCGEDPMFEPVQRIRRGGTTYAAVRVNPAAFAPFTIGIWEVRPLLPGVAWWRRIHGPVRAADASMQLAGDELLVEFAPGSPGATVVRVPLR